jgi:hypothetical protein
MSIGEIDGARAFLAALREAALEFEPRLPDVVEVLVIYLSILE